jgi:hypothetical protein
VYRREVPFRHGMYQCIEEKCLLDMVCTSV